MGLESIFTLLLTLFLQSLSSTVTLEHSPLPPGVLISYESQCGGPEKRDGGAPDRGQCNNVRINQMVRASQDRQKEGSGGGSVKLKQAGKDGGQAQRTMQKHGVVLQPSFLKRFNEQLPQVCY